MTGTLIRILGAACSAMLLRFSYDVAIGPLLAVAAILILIAATDKTKIFFQSLLLAVFYCVFIFFQWSFFITRVADEKMSTAMLLLPLAVFMIHTIPACSCILLFRQRSIESMLIGVLLAEFLFVKFELGDQFFQIGTVLASIPGKNARV